MLKKIEEWLANCGFAKSANVALRCAPSKGCRGYIGPIGDDIPSLIPIVVGLVIFFSAFAFSLNEFNSRSQAFAADRDALLIANTLKGSSYISSYNSFKEACQGLRVRGLKYVAGVVENSQWQTILSSVSADPTRLTDVANQFYSFNNDPNQMLKCSLGEEEFTVGLLQSRPYIVLSFPVALELEQAVVSATLMVVAWRI